MRISKTLLSLSAVALSLTACKTSMDPTFVGSGYTYHHENYKAPPGDKPWSIGYDYTHAQNAEVLDKWRAVASDIVTQLEATQMTEDKAIFLSSPALDNAFTISLDHALRSELRSRGYQVVAVPDEEALKIQASIYDQQNRTTFQSHEFNDVIEGNPEPPKLVNKNLTVKVEGLVADAPVTLVESIYDLPLYGYQDEQRYSPLAQTIAEVWR